MTAAVKPKAADTFMLPSQIDLNLPGTGQQWLDKLRATAAENFSEHGLPTVQDEEWRYTDIRRLKRQNFSLQFSSEDVSQIIDTLPNYDVTRIFLINGLFSPAISKDAIPEGVHIESLATKLANDSLQGILSSSIPAERHAFIDLNTAYCFDGVVITLDTNTVLAKPIEIIHVTTGADHATISHARNIVIAGKHSQADIIERSMSVNAENIYLNNTVTEIIAHDGAQLEHYKIQEEAPQAFHIGGVFVSQSRDSTVVNHNIALGGNLVRNDIQFNLLGTGAHCGMSGLVLGKQSQHVHNHTEVAHRVPHCTSDQFYKNVLDDKSRAIFRGRIIVAQDAQKTAAEQQNDNLLLSADAEANTKPQLEIYADDVTCSHGATIGQLEEKSLFYFQSRGIKHEDAQRLLTFAFVNEVVDRFHFEPLKNELTQRFLGELLPDNYQEVLS